MAVSAYAALLSLADVLNNVQHPARRHWLHLDVDRIQSLQGKVQFLQDFLEVHSQRKSQELEDLARQIRVVADDVEDIIDLHVVDQLREGSQHESHHLQTTLSSFSDDIDKVITKIDSITKELMMIKEDWSSDIQEQKAVPLQPASSSTGLPSTGKDSTMVGFDERLLHIIDELTKDESNLRILPIVGMGGIGKTTLAQNAFNHPSIVNHFDVSELVQIWIGEGFIKSIRGKILEEIANGYLEDLVARNLILIGGRTVRGKIKSCSIHDLLRDLCLREFDKEHFVRNLKVRWEDRWKWWTDKRWEDLYGKLCFMCCKSKRRVVNIDLPIVFVGTRSASVVNIWICAACRFEHPNFAKLRLARVMDDYGADKILEPIKLRCLFLQGHSYYRFQSSSLHLLWNLKTLLVDAHDEPEAPLLLPNEIWEMPQLRYLKFRNALLPDPTATQGSIILENLHTLSGILNFRCTEEVVERIPNIKKL
ncbi:UNVERIFIED_CONTAM: putative late blight resistance proteinR1B-12 [Sesamum radiatum]|uniref:Late blight resistance proteinR1B-12 n=1 Tax=Sesamum radiatum TaxID=300843 RepID=A0AAW2PP61_SESRA